MMTANELLLTEADPVSIDPKIQAILDASLPGFRQAGLRRAPRKVIAAEVRSLFRSMGLKGLSVTAPNYSMAQSIDIRTLRNVPEPVVSDGPGFVTLHPTYREARNAMTRKVEAIVLAAFPDLGDRSDSMTDYHDYRLMIN